VRLSWLAGLATAVVIASATTGVANAHRTVQLHIPVAKRLADLTLGFSAGADVAVASGSASTEAFWVPRAHREGAQMIRLDVDWSSVAPAKPPAGFDPSNPSSPGYNWTTVDEQVRELAAADFPILITVQFAPKWAEGPDMPKTATAGTWEPNATDFGEFAQAIAQRYDGSYPDPLTPGASLPRVSYWQAWDEPNLPEYLAPQWIETGSRSYEPVSPTIYRNMQNAFYQAVKAVSPENYDVEGGLGPYGDSPSTNPTARMHPVAFERDLLCLGENLQETAGCPGPTYFDAIDSHPYGISGPTSTAYYADDVSVPDVHKLTTVLRAAQQAGTVMPHGVKGNWVTEISWDTDPPDPEAVPIQEESRWLEQSLYVLWKQRVTTILWWQLVDSPPIPNYADTYQAGVFFLNGTPKPGATAFKFPFITFRSSRTRVTGWGRAPTAGVVVVQKQLTSGRWDTIAQIRVSALQVFEVPFPLGGSGTLRARLGHYTSLTWSQTAPPEQITLTSK
jgi:hypothetical protein